MEVSFTTYHHQLPPSTQFQTENERNKSTAHYTKSSESFHMSIKLTVPSISRHWLHPYSALLFVINRVNWIKLLNKCYYINYTYKPHMVFFRDTIQFFLSLSFVNFPFARALTLSLFLPLSISHSFSSKSNRMYAVECCVLCVLLNCASNAQSFESMQQPIGRQLLPMLRLFSTIALSKRLSALYALRLRFMQHTICKECAGAW